MLPESYPRKLSLTIRSSVLSQTSDGGQEMVTKMVADSIQRKKACGETIVGEVKVSRGEEEQDA
jgi:hypothetical protein